MTVFIVKGGNTFRVYRTAKKLLKQLMLSSIWMTDKSTLIYEVELDNSESIQEFIEEHNDD